MPIERKGDFYEADDIQSEPSLGIETQKLNACVKEVQRRDITAVFGCPYFGFKQEDLDFFKEILFVEDVWFWDIKLSSIEGLYSLSNLKHFGIHEKRPPIEFSSFPKLKGMVWHHRKRDSGIDRLQKLTRLDLWRYKDKDKSYGNLNLPESLERLEVNWCNPSDLKELPHLPNLKHIQFHYCRNLTSLEGILESAPNLEEIVITRCPNLTEYEMLRDMGLSRIYINIKNKEVANNRAIDAHD